MNRRHFLGSSAALLAVGGGAGGTEEPPRPRRGVSVAGPEFGTGRREFSSANPGKHGKAHWYNSEKTVAYFRAQGVTLLRLPFRWERIQPRPGGPLDAAELGRVRAFVGWARKHGGKVILDVHNYARYFLEIDGKSRAVVIDERLGRDTPVSRDHFADLWGRLSAAFADEPAVEAYGLMNEPHDLGGSDWKAISQRAVDAIRARGDRKKILVAGDEWSSAHHWSRANGPTAWIKDPVGAVAYEAHCYFDADHTGKYADSFAEELRKDPRLERRGVERLAPFLDWCRANKVQGIVGEYGIPAEAGWGKVLTPFLASMDRTGVEGCYWAAGEWWGDYALSIQPRDDFKTPAPQLALLRRG